MTTWTVPATVLDVHDGDTFTCLLDLGWHIWYRTRIRLAVINAPELNTQAGVEARAFALTLVHPSDVVTFTSTALDNYGRPLGHVTLADGRDFGQVMLDSGHAVLYGS